MYNSLENYHSWKSKIYDNSEKILFDEIIKCIDVKAYRAANIIISIAITESLYNKLKILSEGDKNIRRDLENYQNDKKDFLLIQYAKNYNLINEKEYKQLDTIRDARNHYAHPNFESPTEKEVISYLYFAVEYVLKRPPYYSFIYAKSFIKEHLFMDPFYYEGKNDIQIKDYAKTFFRRLVQKNLIAVCNLLFESLENLYNDYDKNKIGCINNCKIYLTELISMDERFLAENFVNDYLDQYRHTSCHIFTYNDYWKVLDSRSKSRIFNYATDFEKSIFSESEFIKIFHPLYKSDLLEKEFSSKFCNILNEISLESILDYELSSKIYFKKIIDYFKTHNFDNQNTAMKALHILDLNQFEDFELEEIGRNILQSAEGNAWDCINLIDNFYDKTNIKFHNINIVQGILNEVFVNENNYFRYKKRSARMVLLLINQYPNLESILNNLLDNIELSLPKYDFINFNQAKDSLKKLKDENILNSQIIDPIISSINMAICNSINTIIDEDYKKILRYKHFYVLSPNIYKCLNETTREGFLNLAYDEPLEFINLFSKPHRYAENNKNKIKVEIQWELLEKFINPIDLKDNVEKIYLDNLSRVDISIIDEFLNNIN